jgi:ribonuclease Y
LFKKEEEIEAKDKQTADKEKEAVEKLDKVKKIREELDQLRAESIQKLEKIAGLNKEQAKVELLEKTEKEYQAEVLERIRKLQKRHRAI